MQFRILGPLEVAEGDRLVSLAGAQRSLLGLLLLSANEVVSADRLIEELSSAGCRRWPGPLRPKPAPGLRPDRGFPRLRGRRSETRTSRVITQQRSENGVLVVSIDRLTAALRDSAGTRTGPTFLAPDT
jgi:hypothetical protein